MPVRRTGEDNRTPEQRAADESALREFEAGRFLSVDPEKMENALKRARARADIKNREKGAALSEQKIKCATHTDHECVCPPPESNTFDGYQKFTRSTAVYPGAGTGNFDAMTYVALKGAGECGEFAEKLGKHMRKQGTIEAISRDAMPDEVRLALAKELGDRLWYIAGAATELGYTLSEIAQINIEKLSSRKQRGKLIGEGDNR